MPNFRQAESEDQALLAAVLNRYHPDLAKHGVTVGLLAAAGGLALHGYPAAALVRVNALRLRVQGAPDCTVELCHESWQQRPEAERRAILDHELEHVVILFEKDGKPKTDDAHRPKLRLKPHDFQIGGFKNVIERHRECALEARQIADATKYIQGLFQW